MKRVFFLVTVFQLVITGAVSSQQAISGPVCVVPGTEYDYFITANAESVSELTVCISGGVFTNFKTNCITIKPSTSVRVDWNESETNAKLSITYSSVTDSLNVKITQPLDPGTINASTRSQKLKYDTASASINCSPASGGNCSPDYSYQWEQSSNALTWSSVKGATGQDLPSQPGLKEPVFYRRKVTETVSGTVPYSTIATLFVAADYRSR